MPKCPAHALWHDRRWGKTKHSSADLLIASFIIVCSAEDKHRLWDIDILIGSKEDDDEDDDDDDDDEDDSDNEEQRYKIPCGEFSTLMFFNVKHTQFLINVNIFSRCLINP